MPRWNVVLFARGPDGVLTQLANDIIKADNRYQAESISIDINWDPRLDAASCVPRVLAERLSDDAGPSTD